MENIHSRFHQLGYNQERMAILEEILSDRTTKKDEYETAET